MYIGSSKNIKNRWYTHKKLLAEGTHHCTYLQNAWNKYGEPSFEFQVLEECLPEELLVKEQWYFDSTEYDLYNLSKVAGRPVNVREDITKLRATKLRNYLRWLKSTKFNDSFERCEQEREGSSGYYLRLHSFDEFYDFVEDVNTGAFSDELIIPEDIDIDEEDELLDEDELLYFLIERPK